MVEGIFDYEAFLYSNLTLPNDTTIYDANILHNYAGVFTRANHSVPFEKKALMKDPSNKNLNLNALKYFLQLQSMLVDEIPNPNNNSWTHLEEINFDFQYNVDQEVLTYKKLSYPALMEFWKDYICLYHSKSSKEIGSIHDNYMRLLKMLLPKNATKEGNNVMKSYEWVNKNCKCTLDKATIFLNPSIRAKEFFYGMKGAIPNYPEINEHTPVDMSLEAYYPNPKPAQGKSLITINLEFNTYFAIIYNLFSQVKTSKE